MSKRTKSLTVADIGEAGLVKRIQQHVARDHRAATRGRTNHTARRKPQARSDAGVVVGIGDDAALIRAIKPAAVLTTDMLVEDIDFELAWARWADVGHKAAAVNLSDLAAMGARPRGLLLSLALRPTDAVRDVMALVATLAKVGESFGAPLVGGDLSKIGGPIVASVTAIGEVDPRKALRRYAGEPGDIVLVSGSLGAAAIGLVALQRGVHSSINRRQLRPTPRVDLGLAFAKAGIVKSAADVSDGLARDALHVVCAGCGVTLEPNALPIDPKVRELAARLGRDPLRLATEGGEDFELVVAVAPAHVRHAQRIAARHGTTLTAIGHITRSPGMKLGNTHRTHAAFDHFRRHPSSPRFV